MHSPIILVPHKGASCMCLLHHELGVVMIHLSTQQLLHGARHLMAASNHTGDVPPRMVPQAHPAVAAMAIWDHKGVLDDAIVLLDVFIQPRQLPRGKQGTR